MPFERILTYDPALQKQWSIFQRAHRKVYAKQILAQALENTCKERTVADVPRGGSRANCDQCGMASQVTLTEANTS